MKDLKLEIEMIHALLFTFTRKPQNGAFYFLFSKGEGRKVASWF